MNCQNNQRKDSCVKGYAVCVSYEGNLPAYSGLVQQPCISIEEVGEDLYALMTDIRESVNVETLDYDCLTTPAEPKLSNVLQLLLEENCSLKGLIATQTEIIQTMQAQILELQEGSCL